MDASKTVRFVLGSGAVTALMTQLITLKTPEELAGFAVSSYGGGLIVFGVVEGLGLLYKKQLHKVLNPDFKFWFAIALAIAVVGGATYAEVRMGLLDFTFKAAVASLMAVYTISQAIHWEFGSEAHQVEHPPDGGAL